MSTLTREDFELLHDSLEVFGEKCLRVLNKQGELVPFRMNASQRYLHEKLEAQRREKGWVRALVLKGRRQGCSTYVAARYYHCVTTNPGRYSYILSHEQKSSDMLFDIVSRFQTHNPLRPHVGTRNIKELVFDRFDSGYAVATAGQKEGGRGGGFMLFHGSEVSRWPNAAAHFAASVQQVPLVSGTEIILETTSAGPSGEFYRRYLEAQQGKGDYIAIFLPWFIEEDNQREPDPGFELSNDAEAGQMSEVELAATFGLTMRQMAWRRSKVHELGSVELFMQEYPATPAEAWTDTHGADSFIPALSVLRARGRKQTAAGPLIVGVDPASGGGDRFAVAARRGFVVEWTEFRRKIDTLEGTQWLRHLIDKHKPARVNIDAGNIGAAIVTNLKSLGPPYTDIVRGVNFGGTSEAKLARPKVPGPYNRRAEMWMRLRDWLAAQEGAQLPDSDDLQADLVAPRMKPKLSGDFVLESKIDMRQRGIPSTDLGDAVALTFASNEFFAKYHERSRSAAFGEPPEMQRSAPRPLVLPGPLSWMG